MALPFYLRSLNLRSGVKLQLVRSYAIRSALQCRSFSEEPFKVSAKMVKSLRDQTGAPMMDCKKALVATKGDAEEAIDWLRKHGVAAAAKKSGRETSDGLIGLQFNSDKSSASLIEVNSETDFVARNETFQDLVSKLANVALTNTATDIESLKASSYTPEESAGDAIIRVTATVRENLALKDIDYVKVEKGFGAIGTYLHNKRGESLGTQASVVALETQDKLDESSIDRIQRLADSLAIHLVGAQALYLNQIPNEVIEKEKEILTEASRKEMEAANASKGKKVEESVLAKRIGKKVDKRLSKLAEQVVLHKQTFVSEDADGKANVQTVLSRLSKELGTKLKI
eukprot:CAMPEP_0184008962 /NCGR_PEP_ID=MMETSP0954-20121128/2304_1 /TAXON_ID=627963 /ORGANISM="Aplanochytrium sp, Strain PBS07" /LENGTH=341 /DNA_ID=CAMNT_0026288209 /DNA_START=10 /DNA_END=1032 /DNA_ORIENTATION=+